jgi:hypothetical protein
MALKAMGKKTWSRWTESNYLSGSALGELGRMSMLVVACLQSCAVYDPDKTV